VCVRIHTRVGYLYVNIDGNININTHTHTHTHTQATHQVQRIKRTKKKSLKNRASRCVCVWGGVHVFVVTKKKKSYIYVQVMHI